MASPLTTSGKYNTIAAIVIGGLVLMIAIGLLLIAPSWRSLQKTNASLPDKKAKLAQTEADREALKKAQRFFDTHDSDVARVTTAVPAEPNVPAILVILETLSKAHNVQLTSFSPQQVAGGSTPSGGAPSGGAPSTGSAPGGQSAGVGSPEGASTIDITANYKGQYADLIKFFYDLESSLRIVDVKTLSVSSSAAEGISGNISFRAYYKPLSAPAAPASGAPGGVSAPAAPAGGGK